MVTGRKNRTGMRAASLRLAAVLAFGFVLFGCEFDELGLRHLRTYEESVKKVTFTGNTATVAFEDLDQHSIYLVKVNTSGSVVDAADTGSALASSPSLENYGRPYLPGEELPPVSRPVPMGHPAAQEFNANPLPINRETLHIAHAAGSRSAFVPSKVGDSRDFWVENFHNSGTWVQRQATLMATGDHGNIWAMNNNSVQITSSQARELSRRFDMLYPLATNILGFEYGGGPGGNGGVDGDPKIQILVYDILDSSGESAAGGYFWSKDFYTQEQLNNWNMTYRTNLAEIFYVNTSTIRNAPDYAYSLLIHELQHMIHFNAKWVKHGRNSQTWYDEMLSMMAEDIIAPLIGIAPSNWYHPVTQRIPWFMGNYNQVGFTEWESGNPNDAGASYAKGFAFGAYLLRNFGGAGLLQKILSNSATNIDSVTSALNDISEGMDFPQALRRFGEAMIFSGSMIPAGALTFDRTNASTVNGVRYTAHGFNIWAMNRRPEAVRGPLIFNLSPMDMRPHSALVQSQSSWQNRSGSYAITLEKPNSQHIELYLMVK